MKVGTKKSILLSIIVLPHLIFAQANFTSKDEALTLIKNIFDKYVIKSKVGYGNIGPNIGQNVEYTNYEYEFMKSEIRIFYGKGNRKKDVVNIIPINKIDKVSLGKSSVFTNERSLWIQCICECIKVVSLPISEKKKKAILEGEKDALPDDVILTDICSIPVSLDIDEKVQDDLNRAFNYINDRNHENQSNGPISENQFNQNVNTQPVKKFTLDTSLVIERLNKYSSGINKAIQYKTDIQKFGLRGKIRTLSEKKYSGSSLEKITTFTFNSKGNLKERVEENFKDTSKTRTAYSYNSNDKLILKRESKNNTYFIYGEGVHLGYYAGISVSPDSRYIYICDNNDNFVETIYEHQDDAVEWTTNYKNHFDQRANLILDSAFTNGVFDELTKYKYNQFDEWVLKETYNANGELISSFERQYNKSGDLVLYKYFLNTGYSKTIGASIFEYENYDPKGNWAKSKEIDQKTGQVQFVLERKMDYY